MTQYCIKCETVDQLLGGTASSGDIDHRTSFVLEEEEENDLDDPPTYETSTNLRTAPIVAPATTEKDSGVHYIALKETVSGLALKYGVPGLLLCTLNRLNPSVLTTNPNLIHTRQFLLLPPDVDPARNVSTPRFTSEQERQRLAIHRLQILEKIVSHAEAQAYIDAAFRARVEEYDSIVANRTRRGEPVGDLAVRLGGELDDARESYSRDRAWEREQVAGKGKGTLGSKMRSTGKVESAVRGWGF